MSRFALKSVKNSVRNSVNALTFTDVNNSVSYTKNNDINNTSNTNSTLIHTTVIYGKAGTGKSTTLSKLISKCVDNNATFVVLTATHSSLNNIYNITSTLIPSLPRSNFNTIYAFFRIDYEKEIVGGCINLPDFIFIDEFSLINKHLFKQILRSIRIKISQRIPHDRSPVNLILTGDMLQLNAIYPNKEYISLSKLSRLSTQLSTPSLYPSVIEHMHLSIFGLKAIFNYARKKQLTVNHRASQYVSSVLNAIYTKDDSFVFPFVDDVYELVGLIERGYVFIASKYKFIQKVYDFLGKVWREKGVDVKVIEQCVTFKCGLKRLYLKKDMELMVTMTSKKKDNNNNPLYYNGEYVKWKGIFYSNGEMVCENSKGTEIGIKEEEDVSIPTKPTYFPVIPKCLITVHKSQGQTIDKVVVCIDEMFDMCMMYTAITRGKEDLKFYSVDGGKDRTERLMKNAYVDEFKQLNKVMGTLNGKDVMKGDDVDDE